MTSPQDALRHVNPLQGTYSHFGFSTGNTLPLCAMPFGMNHWSFQTDEGRWFFNPHARKLIGVRCTHQPSPWMGDYGAFSILPQTGRRFLSPKRRSTSYRIDQSVVSPCYLKTDLIASGTTLEMTPTERGAAFRFVFPAGIDSRVILQAAEGETFVSVLPDRRTIVGFTRGNVGGTPAGFAHYFAATLNREIVSWGGFADDMAATQDEDFTAEKAGIVVELGEADGQPVEMRIATSFISIEQAQLNLRRELGDIPFDLLHEQARGVWEENLGRIRVESDDETKLRTFYSCLYRTQLFPRIWHELDEHGVAQHYSPYDGQVHPGVLYTDNGFWDTYRTEYPLLALLSPSRVGEIMQGWVNALSEGGWFPQWATPGYRACMVGTHIDAVMADAVARGVRNFDMEAALAGMVKHAYEVGDAEGAFGRIGIEDYIKLGYVSHDHEESVARSLDYAYDDFCIAQVALSLGKEDVATPLLARADNYKKLYDPSVGFMRGRNADGSWLEPWDEFLWGSPYVEGGPWQSSWAVQHDPAGLIELNGGDEAFTAKLDKMLDQAPKFTVGIYGFEIHEMTEMACADFGQYAHSNQPVHHVLYLYNAAGRPWRTQKEVRRTMNELYTPDLLPGDEDNGEMSAWYVLSALGIFPLCPGHPSWTLGSPLFTRAEVHLENGKVITVEAPANSDSNVYVNGVSLNETKIEALVISHDDIATGGTLTFEMSATPQSRPVGAEGRPFSMTPYRE